MFNPVNPAYFVREIIGNFSVFRKTKRKQMKKNFQCSIQSRLVNSGTDIDFSGVRTPTPPIFQTSDNSYDDMESGTEILVGKKPGYIYRRYPIRLSMF